MSTAISYYKCFIIDFWLAWRLSVEHCSYNRAVHLFTGWFGDVQNLSASCCPAQGCTSIIWNSILLWELWLFMNVWLNETSIDGHSNLCGLTLLWRKVYGKLLYMLRAVGYNCLPNHYQVPRHGLVLPSPSHWSAHSEEGVATWKQGQLQCK